MKVTRLLKDGAGREFTATVKIADEGSPAFERLVLHLATRARERSRKRASAAGGVVVVEVEEVKR